MSEAAFYLALAAIALHAYQMTLNYLRTRNAESNPPPEQPTPASPHDLSAEAHAANEPYQPPKHFSQFQRRP